MPTKDVLIEVTSSETEVFTGLLVDLGASIIETRPLRQFGADASTVQLIVAIGSVASSVIGGAIWAYVRLKTNRTVRIGDIETRGLSADEVIRLIEARRGEPEP